MLGKGLKMLLKLPRNGEKGFTLIEILVVVAILGTLAAIVIPSIMHLQNEGRVDAANTERYNVQLVVLSAMVDQKVFKLTDGPGGYFGPNAAGTANESDIAELTPPAVAAEDSIVTYITGILQATYDIDDEGHIIDAEPTDTTAGDSKWKGLTYTPGSGWSD